MHGRRSSLVKYKHAAYLVEMHATAGQNLGWHAVQGSSSVTDPAEIEKMCAEGRDAAKFLTQYVVQAELNERGNYGAMPCPV